MQIALFQQYDGRQEIVRWRLCMSVCGGQRQAHNVSKLETALLGQSFVAGIFWF